MLNQPAVSCICSLRLHSTQQQLNAQQITMNTTMCMIKYQRINSYPPPPKRLHHHHTPCPTKISNDRSKHSEPTPKCNATKHGDHPLLLPLTTLFNPQKLLAFDNVFSGLFPFSSVGRDSDLTFSFSFSFSCLLSRFSGQFS